MTRALLLLSLLSACSLYFDDDSEPPPGPDPVEPTPTDPQPSFRLVVDDSMAGERTVRGVDSDGAGGLWIVYRTELGGNYYTPKDVRVVHVDAQRHKVSEWQYLDEYEWISGIAYTGDAVWVNFSGVHDSHFRKLDPATGATLGTFGGGYGISDIERGDGDELLLSYDHSEVVAIDRTSGGVTKRTAVSAPIMYSTQRGIARVAAKNWVTSWMSDEVYVIDGTGAVEQFGTMEPLYGHIAAQNVYLAWDGARLILSVDNQIYWLAIDPV